MLRPAPAKPQIEVVESASYGYRLAWAERDYMLRLAFVPVLVKVICQSIILLVGVSDNYIMQALINLPGYFAMGWLLSHLVRLVLFSQRWPFRPTGERLRDVALLQDRARGVLTGTVMFALVHFLMAGVAALLFGAMPDGDAPRTAAAGETPLPPGAFFAACVILTLIIWAFRFYWLFLPAAANCSVKWFLRRTAPFMTSIHMLGIWLMAHAPLYFILMLIAPSIVSRADLTDLTFSPALLIFNVLLILTETVAMIIATLALSYGYRKILAPEAEDA